MQRNAGAQQQFTSQKHENDMVLKELEALEPDDAVFKLMGPALVKQEPDDARGNVRKRLEFIEAELARLDAAGAALAAKAEATQAKVAAAQAAAVRAQAAAAQASQAAEAAGMEGA
jgi:prefoldin beta subunit